MEGEGWRPAQVDPGVASDDWRSALSAESRQRIVNKIMETLKRYLPISGPGGVTKLGKIAVGLEEEIYSAATSQMDYLRRISLKMLRMESKSTNTNSALSNSVSVAENPPDQALQSVQQDQDQGQPLSIPSINPSRRENQISSQNLQNSARPDPVQSASSLPPTLPSMSGIMTGSSGPSQISENSVNNAIGQTWQGTVQNTVSDSQRRTQASQLQQHATAQQNRQQAPNQQQMLYQQQLQTASPSKSMQHSLMQACSQPCSQPSQISPSAMLPQPQQQALCQTNSSSMLQNQMLGQHTLMSDMKLQQQQNLQNVQHQQLLRQQNNMQPMHQQHSHAILQPTSSALLQQQVLQPQSQSSQQLTTQLQRNFHQRIPFSGGLQQPQCVAEQQFLQQGALADAASSSMDTIQTAHSDIVEWQEEIQALKDMFINKLSDLYQMLTLECQQQDGPFLTPVQSECLEKLSHYRNVIKTTLGYLSISKNSIPLVVKDGIGMLEKQTIQILNLFRNMKFGAPSQQRRQQLLPQSGGQSLILRHTLQQTQQHPHPQIQQHDGYTNQLQSVNIQNSGTSMQPSSVTTSQHGGMSSGQNLGGQHSKKNLWNLFSPGSHLDTSSLGSLPRGTIDCLSHGVAGSLPQNTLNTSQRSNLSTSPQSSAGVLHTNVKMLQNHQLKQFQQRQIMMQQQHKQQVVPRSQLPHQFQQQQLQMHAKQQHSTQLQADQLTQLQQQHVVGKRATYQQLKSVSSVSSPQLPNTASPQISQHSSPQMDQQSVLSVTSFPKVGTPLQTANLPFVVPSPSTSIALSLLPVDSEKPGVSPLSNTRNMMNQQSTVPLGQAQSLAIGTPGISASPLLAEFTSQDGNQEGHPTLLGSGGKTSTTECPMDRLIKAIYSASSKGFTSSVNDISSAMNLIDRTSGSASENGSSTAAGEDLVATTRCRLQARNMITQDSNAAKRKMERNTNAVPFKTSSAGNLKNSVPPELESTATSRIKRSRMEVNPSLLEEIREINLKLIDWVVDVSDEDSDVISTSAEGRGGTVVKCSYTAVSLCPNIAFSQSPPILPLRLLLPSNYPECSPVPLDPLPVEASEDRLDLSSKVRTSFILSIRGLQTPMSLGDMVRTWDICARKVMSTYAQKSGGGSFSSSHGSWESSGSG